MHRVRLARVVCFFAAVVSVATSFVVAVLFSFTFSSAANLAAANVAALMCIPAAIAFFVGAWPSNKRSLLPKRVVVVIVSSLLLAIGIDSAFPLDELSAYALGIGLIWVICVSGFTIAAAIVCASMRQGRWSKSGVDKPAADCAAIA